MTASAFASLPIKRELLASIESLGYEHMTPIQAQALPVLLKRQDLLAQAKTGSGKTAAFAIGLLEKIEVDLSNPGVGAVPNARTGRSGE